MRTRVLVLSSSTGSGHDMRAKAFENWVKQLYGEAVTVRIEQIIENASLLGRFGVWFYNLIHKYCPFLHNIYFFIVELFIFSNSRTVSFGGKYYRSLLESYHPDLVLSVHDSTNRGYFEDARNVLGNSVRCVTYCGEFSGGYGYSRNWVNPRADHFIARTQDAQQTAVKLGMPEERTSIFHKLLPPEAFEKRLSAGERISLRQQLGLEQDRFTVFLATGGYGANHHLRFLKELLKQADRVQVIAVCGRNRKILDRVRNWAKSNPQLKMHIEGYSSRMSQFLQISDTVITRGGANTTMEALHFGCPVIYDSLGGLMPQERCTVRYFLEKEAARMLRRPEDLGNILLEWMRSKDSYRKIRERLQGLHKEEDPRDLIRLILEDG
ncbi:glycosyltransferase [Puniceicoccales bacterium CK1056]|uniref:Glycosyltransferase n=1 Tax=Oceanipulchritudo coccoides TaxID=2706888 RepID=A0A6B2M2T7_9BACT|nr:glycosyltransferase [Oceanipulchritudo coccoides]NDV62509.1 glycosyltransferase [Oceanipulchritudo coccoides]